MTSFALGWVVGVLSLMQLQVFTARREGVRVCEVCGHVRPARAACPTCRVLATRA